MVATALLLNRPSLALLLTLAFVAFLRTSEMLSLSGTTVKAFPHSHSVVIALPSTKTTGKKLAQESVVLVDPMIYRMVRAMLPREGRLYPFTFPRFLQGFRALAVHLGYPVGLFSGYSLRRGGATSHYILHNNLASTMTLGRWQRERTARIYLDDARSSIVTLSESAECRTRVNEAVSMLPQLLRSRCL
eukprot:6489442-Amphidinium_carterae.1